MEDSVPVGSRLRFGRAGSLKAFGTQRRAHPQSFLLRAPGPPEVPGRSGCPAQEPARAVEDSVPVGSRLRFGRAGSLKVFGAQRRAHPQSFLFRAPGPPEVPGRSGCPAQEPARAVEDLVPVGSRLRFGRAGSLKAFGAQRRAHPQNFLLRAPGTPEVPGRSGRAIQKVLALGIFLLTISCLTVAAEAEWPSFRGDARNSGVARGTLPEEPEVLWTFDIEEGVEATAALVGEKVFVGGMDGVLYALGAADGRKLWTYTADGAIRSSPAVAGGLVYFGDEAGFVHAVGAATGEGKWKFETQGEVVSSPNLAGGCVLVGSFDQFLYCLEPAEGKVRWKVETEGPVNGSPAVSGDEVISAGCDGYLRTVHLADGKEVSKVPLGGYVAAGAAVQGSRAFVGSFENEVLGLDLAKDEVLWRYRHPDRAFPFYASAAVAGDTVVIAGRDKMVHALDAGTGKARWVFPTRARIDASPVVLGDRIFVGGESGVLYALGLADGEVRWQFETGSGLAASPAIAGERMVVGTVDGTVYCFGKGPGPAQRTRREGKEN